MRKRIEPTIVEKALATVIGFDRAYQKMQQQVALKGQSKSTLENYIRRIAVISLHFGKLPELVSDEEINEYLASVALSSKTPSRSNFKHAVYGLRYYFRLMGQNKRAIVLPSLKQDTRLPVILNRAELKELFRTPALLKHRIVPLSDLMAKGLKKYISAEHPHIHCIVPAAGETPSGNMKHIGHSGKYLHPVSQLGMVFRGKMMEYIKSRLKKLVLLTQYQCLLDSAWKKPWVVFCEPSLAKPEHVVKYLGQYTHRVAIANHRIINIDGNGVTFMHKDYDDNARQKPVSLSGVEFLRRFCLHILPHPSK